MGHGASVDASASQAMVVFCHTEVQSACTRFLECPDEGNDFVTFIKEGTWLDDICANPNFLKQDPLAVLPKEAELLFEYIVPSRSHKGIKACILKMTEEEDEEQPEDELEFDSSDKTIYSVTASNRSSARNSLDSSKTQDMFLGTSLGNMLKTSNAKTALYHDFHDDYVDLEHVSTQYGLSKYQLLAVLFAVLHPLFLRSRTPGRSPKPYNKFCFLDMQGHCQCSTPCRDQPAASAEACRAQELLLAAAAYFDQDRMLQVLCASSWLKCVPLAIENSPLGISVCDARSGQGFPITYTNKMLQHVTGYSFKQLQGKTFKLLQGPGTETEQVKLMSSALRAKQSIKVALTNYRQNGTTFMNMLVLKPVVDALCNVCYVVGITFDVSRKEASVQELQQADVLLALLPLILTAQSQL